jgi:uncharacterized membrane protein
LVTHEVHAVSDTNRYHLAVFAFDFREMADLSREKAAAAAKGGDLTLSDWAIVTKETGGKVRVASSKATNPGGLRGGLFGGGAGLVLAVLAGPIGAGAVLGGAAIGAVTAGLVDSGFPADRLKEISRLMREERSLLLLAVPQEDVASLDALVEAEPAFRAADGRYDVDISPNATLADAIAEYRVHEEDEA